MKNLIFFSIFSTLLFACKQSPKQQVAEIHFETMGTFGMVKIVSDSLIDEETILENINTKLIDFNNNLSTYIESSNLSRYNNGDNEALESFCFEVIDKSVQVFRETNGSFNPSVQPLLQYWKNNTGDVDSIFIDSIVNRISKAYTLDDGKVWFIHPFTLEEAEFQMYYPIKPVDFSAIAKGYGVDYIAYFIQNLGYTNFMVEIGGEVVTRGKNQDASLWRLGIEEPNEEIRSIYEVVELENQAMATSGNYRNFKILENGQKIVHIINPKTGYPEISNLLSASIVAPTCMEADAYATACMVMGLDTCFEFLLKQPDLEGYLIYSNENGDIESSFTNGFEKMLVE